MDENVRRESMSIARATILESDGRDEMSLGRS
jgi:hypothetical protein